MNFCILPVLVRGRPAKTTVRGHLKCAIRSRIHLALQYEAPDASRRAQMWKQQFKLHADLIDLDVASYVASIEHLDMNGREIANTVNTALTLANSEETKLTQAHLDLVVKVWVNFQESLRGIEARKIDTGECEDDECRC